MKTLTLVIPVYNEGARINKTLESLKKGFNFVGLKLEKIIFSDDGSSDNSIVIINREKNALEKILNTKIEVLNHTKNNGRGFAVRRGALASLSNYVLYADADFSIPLYNLNKFIPYLNQDYDLLFGSKKMPGSKELIRRKFSRRIVGYGHSFIASFVLGIFAWDFQGGFKIFSRRLIKDIFHDMKIDRWGFDMEIIFLAKKFAYKTAELPVTWGHVENGSKVKLIRDILRSLKEMILIKYYWIKGVYYKPLVTHIILPR